MEQTATTRPASGAHTAAAESPQPTRRECERAAPSPPGLGRKIGALAWSVVPPLVVSALLHSTDTGVGGIEGMARPGVLLSVAVWAVPMVVLALLTLWTRVRAGLLAALATAAVLAAVPGWFILLLGSTAATPLARLGSFLGLMALCLITLGLAALPAAAIGWPARR
ncbi:MAG: hypothetical protein MUF10_07045 [Thermoanaerobaculaceae bacterium]|jgi:hypothetical protein|nr:hypothetical protein [Thermoanaerobaculaceae bacterium]